MNEIQRYTGSSPVLTRHARGAVRQVSAIRAAEQVRRSQLDAESDFAIEAASATSDVHGTVMRVYAHHAQMRQQYEMQNPAVAAGMAQLEADLLFGLSEETASFHRALRRL